MDVWKDVGITKRMKDLLQQFSHLYSTSNSLLTRVYRKKTFTGLLTNYFSFTSYSYKVGLIRTLVDRAYKINNTWLGLHEDKTKLTEILKKNLFPAHLIEKVVNRYITGTHSNHCPRGLPPYHFAHILL